MSMEWTGSAWAGNGAYKERGPVFKVGDHSQIALWEASVPDSADWLQSRSRRANTHKSLSINQISLQIHRQDLAPTEPIHRPPAIPVILLCMDRLPLGSSLSSGLIRPLAVSSSCLCLCLCPQPPLLPPSAPPSPARKSLM